mgnify:CR=1 FL=1
MTELKKFFQNYFGNASEYLMKYYSELRSRFKYLEDELGVKFYIYIETEKRDYWPLALLNQWIGYLDSAKQTIDDLQYTNKDLYESIIKRIDLESISLKYLKIQLYGDIAYNEVTLLQEKKDFRKLANSLNISNYREAINITELYTKWGLS